MDKRMSWALKLVTFLALHFTTSVLNAVAAPPRLWEITGANKQGLTGKFYILPVTHNGLESEYDSYFHQVVMPIAMSVDTFSSESAILLSVEVPPCLVPLWRNEVNKKLLQQAYQDVERATYELRTPIPREDWMSNQDWKEIREIEHILARNSTKNLSEFGLILEMSNLLFNKQLDHPELMPKIDYTPNPEIAHFIAHQRTKLGNMKNESIDQKNDLVDSYCAISPNQRARYLKQKIAESDPLTFVPLSKSQLDSYSIAFSESLKKEMLHDSFSEDPDDEYSRHAVCDRNEKWLARMTLALNEGTTFYALGMAHVLQAGTKNPTRCDGLLTRLRRAGFAVRLIEKNYVTPAE